LRTEAAGRRYWSLTLETGAGALKSLTLETGADALKSLTLETRGKLF
jgi:hypothetical protein